MQPDKDRRKLLLGIGAIFGFILLFVWFFTFGPGTKTSIEIYVVPSDTRVTMDGKPIDTGKVSVKPGKHTFEASRQYFGSVKKEVNTAELEGTKTIYLALEPNSPEGEAYLKAHPEEQLRYERVAGSEFSALQRRILEQYPVTTKLPYTTLDYKVDYDVTKEGDVVFLVTFYLPNAIRPGTDAYKQELLRLKAEALDYLESQDVDTKKAQVRYSPDPSAL